MLFEPDRHEPLTDTAWDEARVREVVQAIAEDIEAHRRADGQWPLHALDAQGDGPPGGFKGLYLGSAGNLWALWWLAREGAVRLRRDPADAIAAVLDAYRAAPDSGSVVPSLFLGEAGILLVQWRFARDAGDASGRRIAAEAADRLLAVVASNVHNPTLEALWGAPGTMVAAWHLWCATEEPRWRDLFVANVEALWRTWLFDEAAGCHLWTQDLYGHRVQYLGAAHGFAGNVYPLLKGAALLDAQRRQQLYERCVATLERLALREPATGDLRERANWPPGRFAPRPAATKILMQWCHGAPGIVTALADLPHGHSARMDELLAAAAEAVWQAGPLTKGPGLCHGTTGNAMAFLKLYRRSSEALWLERARRFAMHAIEQCEDARRPYGRGRYTLWTGDAGVAMVLWQCIAGSHAMPGLDSFA